MTSKNELLISLKPRFCKSIFDGLKTVELRRKTMKVDVGDLLWIYSTLPEGCIAGSVIVDGVATDHPSKIWRKFGKRIQITKAEFDCYVADRETVSAILLKNAQRITSSISLEFIRERSEGFQPPQFMHRVRAHSGLWNILRA